MARANDTQRGRARRTAVKPASRRPSARRSPRRPAAAPEVQSLEPEVTVAEPPKATPAPVTGETARSPVAAAGNGPAEAVRLAAADAAETASVAEGAAPGSGSGAALAPADEPAAAAVAVSSAVETPPMTLAPAQMASLIEGILRLQGQLIAYTRQQTECGLAAGRAMLASRSLPGLLALQAEFVGRSLENALTHGLEVARLSGEMLRSSRLR